LNREEVLAFEGAIFAKVRAVNGIHDTINSILGTKCLWAQVLCDFRVHRAAEFSERLHDILLSYFHHNARASCHVLRNCWEFGKHALVDLQKFFRCRLVKGEHLHSRNLESFLQNGINNFTCKTSLHNMRLDNGASAIGEVSRC